MRWKLPNIKEGDECVIIKIAGVLVDLLVDISSEVYGPYVVTDKRVLYVQVLRGLYGMLLGCRSTMVHQLVQEGP
jgi:hypothetical protein